GGGAPRPGRPPRPLGGAVPAPAPGPAPGARGGPRRSRGATAVDLRRAGGRRSAMGAVIDPREERLQAALKRLQLTHTRDTLASVLSEAAKRQWTYLEFLDEVLSREVEAKQGKRIPIGMQIAHFPS